MLDAALLAEVWKILELRRRHAFLWGDGGRPHGRGASAGFCHV